MVESKYRRQRELNKYEWILEKIKANREIDAKYKTKQKIDGLYRRLDRVKKAAEIGDDKTYNFARKDLNKLIRPYINWVPGINIGPRRIKRSRAHKKLEKRIAEIEQYASFSMIIGTIMIIISLFTLIRRK